LYKRCGTSDVGFSCAAVSAEVKLQDVDVDVGTRPGHVNDHRQTSAAEAETVLPKPPKTLLSSSQNVGNEPLRNGVEQEGKALAADQQVEEQACQSDPLYSGKEEEVVAATHAEKEHLLSENPQRHAFDSTGKANLGPSTGPISSSASLVTSPSPPVKHSGPSPPFNNSYPSVSTTSSVSTASPFEGFQSQSRDVIAFTSPVTPQFSKPGLEQSGADGKVSLVAKPLFKASGSSSSPSTSPVLKLEKSVPSDLSPRVEDKPQPAASLSQSSTAPVALPTDGTVAEALDSQLSILVSGQPLTAQRARKGSQASSLPVPEVNGCVAQPARKPKAQPMELPQSGLVHPPRASKELNRSSSMRDQGPVKSVLPKTLENGSSRLEPDDALSGRSKESNPEDDRDGSLSNLLVEDVHSQTYVLLLYWLSNLICEFIVRS
jgi:hypothetical protein